MLESPERKVGFDETANEPEPGFSMKLHFNKGNTVIEIQTKITKNESNIVITLLELPGSWLLIHSA